MLDRIELGALPQAPTNRDAGRFFYLLHYFARLDAQAAARYVTSLLLEDPHFLAILPAKTEQEISPLIDGVTVRIDAHLPRGYAFAAELDESGMYYNRYTIRPDPALLAETDELVGVILVDQKTRTATAEVLVDPVNAGFVTRAADTELAAAEQAATTLLDLGFLGALTLTDGAGGDTILSVDLAAPTLLVDRPTAHQASAQAPAAATMALITVAS